MKQRYDPNTHSFILEDIDLRSYMLGYLQGCEDCRRKYTELTKIEFSIPAADMKYNNLGDCAK